MRRRGRFLSAIVVLFAAVAADNAAEAACIGEVKLTAERDRLQSEFNAAAAGGLSARTCNLMKMQDRNLDRMQKLGGASNACFDKSYFFGRYTRGEKLNCKQYGVSW